MLYENQNLIPSWSQAPHRSYPHEADNKNERERVGRWSSWVCQRRVRQSECLVLMWGGGIMPQAKLWWVATMGWVIVYLGFIDNAMLQFCHTWLTGSMDLWTMQCFRNATLPPWIHGAWSSFNTLLFILLLLLHYVILIVGSWIGRTSEEAAKKIYKFWLL